MSNKLMRLVNMVAFFLDSCKISDFAKEVVLECEDGEAIFDKERVENFKRKFDYPASNKSFDLALEVIDYFNSAFALKTDTMLSEKISKRDMEISKELTRQMFKSEVVRIEDLDELAYVLFLIKFISFNSGYYLNKTNYNDIHICIFNYLRKNYFEADDSKIDYIDLTNKIYKAFEDTIFDSKDDPRAIRSFLDKIIKIEKFKDIKIDYAKLFEICKSELK